MATTYFVRKSGSDANSGLSAALAKLTIQAAINLATTAGDTVYVGAGSYRETVTLAASGSAGNVISIIGDYAGTQTGDAGVVRLTGSADDLVGTRSYCINSSARSYVTIRGLLLDGYTSQGIRLSSSPSNITIDQCYIDIGANDTAHGLTTDGASQAAIAIKNCVFVRTRYGNAIWLTTATANAGHTITSCVFIGGADNARAMDSAVGGVAIRNCYVLGGMYGFAASGLPGGYTAVTINNCLIEGCTYAINSGTAGMITENYNRFWANAVNRTNVSTGANSLTGPPLHDRRWFFNSVAGGTVLTPYDLASYSPSVELNSGSGAPSTDLRGASQTGSYREWGPLEYNAALSVSGGSALGLPIVGSAIVRGAE